jgi:hypothetical protein
VRARRDFRFRLMLCRTSSNSSPLFYARGCLAASGCRRLAKDLPEID